MDFSWTTGWEKAAADDDEAESAPAPAPPAPSPQEAAESMILVPGPRVVLSGLMRGDCRAGGFFPLWFVIRFPGCRSCA